MGLVLIQTFFEFMLVFIGLWTFEGGFIRKLISFFSWISLISLLIFPQFWIQETTTGTLSGVFITLPTTIIAPFISVFSSLALITLYSMILDIFTWRKQKRKILSGETRNV
jgi:hypothetical protein